MPRDRPSPSPSPLPTSSTKTNDSSKPYPAPLDKVTSKDSLLTSERDSSSNPSFNSSQHPTKIKDSRLNHNEDDDGLKDIVCPTWCPAWMQTIPLPPQRHMRLFVGFIVVVIVAVANQIAWVRMIYSYRARNDKNFGYFVNVWTVFLYCGLVVEVVLYKRLFTKDIPNYRFDLLKSFIFMGFLDATASFFSSIGGALTPGSLQTLLNQLLIPLTLLFSLFWLKHSYSIPQYIGAFLIFIGAIIATIPSFLNINHPQDDPSDVTGVDLAIGIIIFTLGVIPSAFASVYKEHVFHAQLKQGKDINQFLLTLWVSTIQVLWGFTFLPILLIPHFPGSVEDDVQNQFTDGWKCFTGENPVIHSRSPTTYRHCDSNPLWTLLYVVINFIYNILLLTITKEESALMMVIASAVTIPIINGILTVPAIMGDAASPGLNSGDYYYDVIALVVVMVGFVGYAFSVRGGRMTVARCAGPIGTAGQMHTIPSLQSPSHMHLPPRWRKKIRKLDDVDDEDGLGRLSTASEP